MNNKIFNKIFLLFLLLLTVYSIACPENVGQLIRKAKDNYDGKIYSKAKENALEVIKQDGNILEAHKIYIKSCNHLSKKAPAEMDNCIAFYRMMFYEKNKPVFLFALGFAYLQKDKIKEAQEAFNQSIKLNTKSPYIKDMDDLARKYKLTLEFPTRSFGEDIKLWAFAIISFIIIFIIWFVYKGYSERKMGEKQVAKIKKDRSIDFFGRKRY